MAFAEELDSDLGLSLARARRLAQLKDQAKQRKSRDVGEVSGTLVVGFVHRLGQVDGIII